MDKELLQVARLHSDAVKIIATALKEISHPSLKPEDHEGNAVAIIARLAHGNILLDRYTAKPTLDDLLGKYREVKSELQDLTQKMFPVGAKVQVGENPSIAVVDHYRDEAPELAFVKFENGNVWPKLVEILERVPDELQVQDVAQKCDEHY